MVNAKPNGTIYSKDSGTLGTIKAKEKLEALSEQATNVLYEIANVFPFELFTDKIIIRPTKVDLVYGVFFFSNHIVSMLLRDMRSVKVSSGIFFATIDFELQGYEENPPPIRFFWKEDAFRARRIIVGLMAAEQNGVDLTKLTAREIMEKVEQIGQAREDR